MPPDSPADSGNLARLKMSEFHPLRTFRSVIACGGARGDGMIIKHIARFVRPRTGTLLHRVRDCHRGRADRHPGQQLDEARVEKARVHQQVASLGTELQANLATIGR